MSYAQTEQWDLLALFPGGPTSPTFEKAVVDTGVSLRSTIDQLRALPPLSQDLTAWRIALSAWFELHDRLADLYTLTMCHTSAHTDDAEGRRIMGLLQDMMGSVSACEVLIDATIGVATDTELDQLATGDLSSWRPAFERTRQAHALQLEPALQGLLAEVDREALHAWGQLYDTVVGSLTAPVEERGETHVRSIAQLMNARSSPDGDYRVAAFNAVESAFEGVGDVCAAALSSITGTRQMRLDRVEAGPLANSLLSNRINQRVLDAMWEGSATVVPALLRYLDRKARLLDPHASKLRWCDQFAPIGSLPGGGKMTWTEAQDLIVDSFASFEPDLAEFAANLLREGGVEAEDRGGKLPGGYCAGFEAAKTSRIFLTFGGSVMESVVLAHELGHAWHNHLLFRAPSGHRQITMSLAESASTYAESIVRDQIHAAATTTEANIAILDQKLQAAVAFLMNIRARFDFERSLYDLRRKGPFTPALLEQTMERSCRSAYHEGLADYERQFWASKQHFYISHFGFYNWPYTFGYLFSSAMYTRAKAEGPGFRKNIVDLLMRTGWQDSIPLAKQTLGVDLEDPDFWSDAAAPIVGLVEDFEAIT